MTVKAGPIARAVMRAIKHDLCHQPVDDCGDLSDCDANLAAAVHWCKFPPPDCIDAKNQWFKDANT